MSWVNELIDLYEINSDKIGVIEYRGEMPHGIPNGRFLSLPGLGIKTLLTDCG